MGYWSTSGAECHYAFDNERGQGADAQLPHEQGIGSVDVVGRCLACTDVSMANLSLDRRDRIWVVLSEKNGLIHCQRRTHRLSTVWVRRAIETRRLQMLDESIWKSNDWSWNVRD